jgi:retron-type reverse transcriptase
MWYHYSQRFLLTEHVNKLNKDTTLKHRPKHSIDDIIKLLRFKLSNSFFNYNKQTYKQIHGCAMGSPVSPIVANLCMEEIEELAHSQSTSPPKRWFRYVDIFSIKKHALTIFYNLLNSIDPHIKFTMEQELDGKTVILGHFSHTIMDLY